MTRPMFDGKKTIGAKEVLLDDNRIVYALELVDELPTGPWSGIGVEFKIRTPQGDIFSIPVGSTVDTESPKEVMPHYST